MSSVLYELLENHDWWCFLCELIATENKLYFTFESSEVVSVFKHSRICCVPSTLPVSPSLHSSSGHRFLFKHNGGSKVTTGYMRVCIKSCHPIKWCLTTLLWRWAPYKGYENILPRFTFTLTEHVKSRWTWKKKMFLSLLAVASCHMATLRWATTGTKMRQHVTIKQSLTPKTGKWTQTENELEKEEGSNVN